jgi:predicted O-methyltransferase YrrM
LLAKVKSRLYELRDPAEAYRKAVARWHERRKPRCDYVINHDWRERLGVTAGDCSLVETLLPSIIADMQAKHIRTGPESYLYWNDGDPALIQAICCLIRRTQTTKIVETGVAHGLTSRFILEALSGRGHLWSIDLPPPGSPEMHKEIGIAVGDRLRQDWSLIFGSSRKRLPPLLDTIAPIDMFVHDSHHSEYNMLFEMSRAWPAVRPGGAMVVDDIDLNWAFHEFSETIAGVMLIGEAEPIRPDTRRFNQKGLFGIILKPELSPKPVSV